MPELLVVTVRTTPRDSVEITTFALGTTAPEGSLTSPVIPATPPADCARQDAADNKKIPAVKLNVITFNCIKYLLPCEISNLAFFRNRRADSTLMALETAGTAPDCTQKDGPQTIVPLVKMPHLHRENARNTTTGKTLY
jgi:hypothetical protein